MNYNYPMKLLVGLGNPGDKYIQTRHNVGFMFLDFMYEKSEVTKPWKFDKYMNAEIAQVTYKDTDFLLAKPQTFMNRSGETIKQLTTHYNLQPNDCYIAHDDLDFKLGDFKISLGKGPKLHNGITSIENMLRTKDFFRIRIGIDNRTAPIPGETYVLSNFTQEELRNLQDVFSSILISNFQ